MSQKNNSSHSLKIATRFLPYSTEWPRTKNDLGYEFFCYFEKTSS